MLGEGRRGEASLCWRSIHKNYFYLFFRKKTTEDKDGRESGGVGEKNPAKTSIASRINCWNGVGVVLTLLT